MNIPKEIKILYQIARLLPSEFAPKIKDGTLCLYRERPASKQLLSAVALIRDKFEIYCVENRDKDSKLVSATIKLQGPTGEEVLNLHYKNKVWHTHAVVNGEKQEKHLPGKSLQTFVTEVVQAVKNYP